MPGGASGAEPVRVLRLVARLNMGGPALHVSYLTRGLEPRGYSTTLAVGRLARGEGSMSFVTESLGVEVTQIPQLHRELSPLLDPVSVARIAQLIRELRPQIVHTHTAKAGAVGRIAAVLSGSARPPVLVHTFHGHVLRGYFDPARTAVFREIERGLAKVTTRLIAVSPEVRDDLVELGVAGPEKFSVIRLGVDLEGRIEDDPVDGRELRRLFGIGAGSFVVGWIGRMTAIKHLPDVLAVFTRLRERGVDATLCLVGDGPDREAVERRAHELGIARRTLFVGYQDEVGPYYRLFDALLLPSGNEGTPVVAIESLAAGTPVVATDVGGVSDVVEHGVDGFLAPVGEIDELASALERLASDPGLRAEMSRAGRERTLPRYRVERLVDDVDNLYRELLAEQGLPLPAARRRAGG